MCLVINKAVQNMLKKERIPCLLSTSIKEVNAVPPTVHSATGAPKFPTWRHNIIKLRYLISSAKTLMLQEVKNSTTF
jgi:hypothetical protein